MERKDRERILRKLNTNAQLKRLYREHELLEEKLGMFAGRRYLTPGEQKKEAELKLQKLRGVDRMMALLADEAVMPEGGAAEAH